ncbi:hypothetical protein [Paenibacillus cellulosilyticus]|uniref:hypothetical protein n=1 Tax=Paenibacillus cellulosilyticus TaxID=375489 RepID=UPI0011B3F69F|nr:hypothetical protein [Paenibacillus cellulosilyticus]
MNKTLSLLALLVGIVLIGFGALPSMFPYPFSDSPNSGPSNTWELVLMIAYDQWLFSLLIGFGLCVFAVYSIRQRRD